ncbi:uncharacterized protein [Hyperolius riggenbachi]|uniref:uncharacterized protein n=1 Tax=Hyperolius riggenbachi TaxID=752182 RepID=UPI0035A33D12
MDKNFQKRFHPQSHKSGVQDSVSILPSKEIYFHVPSKRKGEKASVKKHSKINVRRKRGHSGSRKSNLEHPGILFDGIFSKKADGEIQTDSKPKGPEPLRILSEIQDGINLLCANLVNPKLYNDKYRSEGRLLAHSNKGVISKVPQICNKRKKNDSAFSIQSSTFRDIIGTEDILKGNGGGDKVFPHGRDSCNPVPRRSPGSGRIISEIKRKYRKGVRTITNPRMDSKLGQISPSTNIKDPVSGSHYRFRDRENVFASRKDREVKSYDTGIHNKASNDDKTSNESFGIPDINGSSYTVGNDAYKTLTKLDAKSLEQDTGQSRDTGHMSTRRTEVPGVVVIGEDTHRRQDVDHTNREDYHDRCKSYRLGCTSAGKNVTGAVAKVCEEAVIQLQGASSYTESTRTECTDTDGSSCSGQVRQHHSGSISESARGYKVSEADGTGHEHINNSGKEFSIIISNTSEGIIKHDSRFSEQTKDVKYRDGNIRQDVQKIDHTVGSTTSRYVRNQAKHKVQKILLPESKRRSRSGRCAKSELDIRQGVRISTNTASATSITQVIKDQDSSNYGSPGLASKKLVSTTTKDEAGGSNKDSGQGSTSSGIKKNWKLYSKSKPVSLASERSPLRKKGVSERVISTLLDCRKKVTRKIYLKYWKTFNMWQEESGFKGDLVPTILEFLQDGVEKNISLSTLKVQVAAISTFMDERLARDPLIIQFFKSVERKKPMLKKKVPSWDLSLVLKVLKKEPFEPIADISFRLLTMKTVFLIAITSARRVSELEALCCDEPFCIILRDEVILKTCDEFLPKVTTKFHRSQDIVLPSFKEEQTLDVRRCLMCYLERVAEFRNSRALLINTSGAKRGSKMSKRSIARWIKLCIEEAYRITGNTVVDTIRAHSARAAATSWAYRAGATPEEICRAATWSSLSTFSRHYRIDLMSARQQSFGKKVLQAVSPP